LFEGPDEISSELWRLQHDLRLLTELNNRRRTIVREKAIDEMAYQEYQLVVDEINRQVDHLFQKRYVSPIIYVIQWGIHLCGLKLE
jgi:transcriptional adapter 3